MPYVIRFLSALLFAAITASIPLVGTTSVAAQDRIYISSRNTHDVLVYDAATGDLMNKLFEPVNERQRPQEVVFDQDGALYVTFIAGEESNVIHSYDPLTGDDLGRFSSGYGLESPTKMRIGPDGDFYVSQWGASKFNVAVFDGDTGEFIREATTEGVRRNLMEMAWDSQGRLFVAAFGSGTDGTVRRYNSDGSLAATVIDSSVLDGPVNIWFNEDGTLNVIDWTRARIEVYDVTTGDLVRTLVEEFPAQSRLEGWTIGPDGLLYVCDWLKNEVNRYDPDTGDFIDTFMDDFVMSSPNSIKFGPAVDIAVEDDPTMPSRSQLLAPNRPNPFAHSTSIDFHLDRDVHARLTVFDLFGREVAILVDEQRPAGDHTVRFLPGGLPSGLYVYRLQAGKTSDARVMTLIR